MTRGGYREEKEMYPDVMEWLKHTLQGHFPAASVTTYDTSRVRLSRFLEARGLESSFPLYQSFDIRVDVTGVVQEGTAADLAFVECKLKPISLRDLSQLLGYSRVALPVYSIIVSPAGTSAGMNLLLQTYGRLDVLEYEPHRRIKVATWNGQRKEVDLPTLIPRGDFS